MNYIALYRKWRPMTFDEVVEQESVVTILKNSVKSKRIAHAYLFAGTRGTGKTSVAKIFSRAINCLNPVDGNPCNQCEICKGILNDSLLDVAEIDAASNNGIDSIRDIIDVSSYQASRAEYKVFIIDEVHMLSVSAFNALLKTLEEPPEKVVFILATTEPQKIPVTILSRCQRYNFMRISRDGIVGRLVEICEKTGLEYDSAALKLIAGKADGGLRDAISLLDQTIAFSEGRITVQSARKAAGSIDNAILDDFTEALLSRDGFKILTLTDSIFAAGADPANFISEIIGVLRSLMICLSTRNPKQFLYEDDKELEHLKKLASYTNTKEITLLIRELSSLENRLKWSIQRKIVFEAGVLSLCDRTWSKESELSERVVALEKEVADLVNNGLKLVPGSVVTLQAQTASEPMSSAEEKPADPGEMPEEPEPDLSREVLSALSPVDEASWSEFIASVRKTFQGVASMLSTRVQKAYIIGKTLYIPLDDRRDIAFVTDGKRIETLKTSAALVFNKVLNVKPVAVDAFFEQAPDLISKANSGEEEDTEEANTEAIARFAETNGIDLEIEEFDQGATSGAPGVNPDEEEFDMTGFEPNSTENADSFGAADDFDPEKEEDEELRRQESEDVPPAPVASPADSDDFNDDSDEPDDAGDGESMYGGEED